MMTTTHHQSMVPPATAAVSTSSIRVSSLRRIVDAYEADARHRKAARPAAAPCQSTRSTEPDDSSRVKPEPMDCSTSYSFAGVVPAASSIPLKRKEPDTTAADLDEQKSDPSLAHVAKKPRLLAKRIYNLRGIVETISPVMRQGDSAMFFLDLQETDKEHGRDQANSLYGHTSFNSSPLTTTIVFTGLDSLTWHAMLRVGEEYIVTRMHTSELAHGGSGQCKRGRMVFANTPPKPGAVGVDNKQTLILDTELRDIRIKSACNLVPMAASPSHHPLPTSVVNRLDDCPTAPPAAPAASSSSAALIASSTAVPTVSPLQSPLTFLNYTGTITACPLAGIFQLDGDDACMLHVHPLHLTNREFHQPLLSGLNIGVRVRLHHVHLIRQAGRSLGFACCMRSTIEVLPSSTASPSIGRTATEKHGRLATNPASLPSWYTSLWLHRSARDLVLLLHLFRLWERKLGHLISGAILFPDPASNDHSVGAMVRLLADVLNPSSTPPSGRSLPVNGSDVPPARTAQMYSQFLDHESCELNQSVGVRGEIPMPFLIHIADLSRMSPIKRMIERFNRSLPSTLVFPSPLPDWRCRTLHSSSLPARFAHVRLIGVLQSTFHPTKLFERGGSKAFTSVGSSPVAVALSNSASATNTHAPLLRTPFQLVDKSGCIDCSIIGEVSPILRNSMVWVTKYLVVLETASVKPSLQTPAASVAPSSNNPGPSSSSVPAAPLLDQRTKLTLLIDARDLVVLHPSVVPHRAKPAAAATGRDEVIVVLTHKSGTIHQPSVTTAATPTAAIQTMQRGVAAASSASKSLQPTLKPSAFNHILQTNLEVHRIDPITHETQPVAIELTGSGVDWFPFLPLYRPLRLTNVRQASDSSRFEVAASSLVQFCPLPCPVVAPLLLDVHDVLVCAIPTCIMSPSGIDVDIVSFRGIVLEKQFRVENPKAPNSSYRRWWVNVRDVTTVHTVHVHIDPTLHVLPVILPGSLIHFHRFQRKILTNYHIQLEDTEHAHIELVQAVQMINSSHHEEEGTGGDLADDTDRLVRDGLQDHFPSIPLPVTHIVHLSPFAPCIDVRLIRLRVRIGILTKLLMQWSCGFCGRPIVSGEGRCASGTARNTLHQACRTATPHLRIECTVLVDDGSGVATVFIDGPPVWDLLRLSLRHRAQLESFSRDLGCFEFFRVNHRGVNDESISLTREDDVSQLRRTRRQMWEKRLREDYGGLECNLFARQIYMKAVMQAAVTRERGKAHAQAQGDSSSSNMISPAGASIPFASCSSRPIAAGPHKLATLQPPPITLKAVEIQTMQAPQTKVAARAILQELQQKMFV